MQSSSINRSGRSIVQGMALAEDGSDGVILADSTSPAFALAIDGTQNGGVLQWADDGTVIRSDWSMVAGTKFLSPGSNYYAAANGMISTSGTQKIGVALDRGTLRISITEPAPSVSRIYPVTSPPSKLLGSVNDLAINHATGVFYTKMTDGWRESGRLVKALDTASQVPVSVSNSGGSWALCS